MTKLLQPQYDSRASFYGKAIISNDEDTTYLTSYSTVVAKIVGRVGYPSAKAIVNGTYSVTTLRHIKEFLKQNGFKAETSKQIMADYGPRKAV